MSASHEIIAVFGRLPKLSYLDIAAVLPVFKVKQAPGWLGREAIRFQRESAWSEDELKRLQVMLGGTVRLVRPLATCTAADFAKRGAELATKICSGEGKLTIGVSSWAVKGQPKPAASLARQLKHVLALQKRSVRVVIPSAGHQLSGAQLLHNKLIQGEKERKAMELACFWLGNEWLLGVTETTQDIADYSRRDFGIPKPDAVSGMLPPKLAQTMLNLAVGADREAAVYDPFCGNGRVLLEALLFGLPAFGSDLEQSKVAAAQENTAWLVSTYGLADAEAECWQQDARQENAPQILTKHVRGKRWHLVTEPYLGKPLRQALSETAAKQWVEELVPLYRDFLQVWAKAGRNDRPVNMVVVFPRVKLISRQSSGVFDALVDRLEGFGYSAEVLFCYDRPDSIVQRDLVRITYR